MVNFLVLGDIHGALPALREIRRLLTILGTDLGPDAVFTTGDFVNFFGLEASHRSRAARNLLSAVEAELSRYECEVLCVAGNHDRSDLWGVTGCLRSVDALAGALAHTVEGFRVVGMGGSWRLGLFPYEWEDGAPLTKRVRELLPARDGTPEIFLVHAPPAGAGVGRLYSGEETGSRTIEELILERQPVLTVCGHVHEAAGWGSLGRTCILNAGSVAGVARLADPALTFSGPADLVKSQANFYLLRSSSPPQPILVLEGHLIADRWLLRWLRVKDGQIEVARETEGLQTVV